MSILGKALDLGDKTFGRMVNWTLTGSKPVVAAKVSAISLAAMTSILGPLHYAATENQEALKARFANLDRSATETFTSVSGCIFKGYGKENCQNSQEEALKTAKTWGTTLSYDSSAECTMKHGVCHDNITMVPVTSTTVVPSFNNSSSQTVTTVTLEQSSSYHPALVGWQAKSSDLSQAVPLYSTQTQGMGVRFDGKEIRLGL